MFFFSIQKAESALKYYKGYKGKSSIEDDALFKEFERLKAISCEQKIDEKLHASDFCKYEERKIQLVRSKILYLRNISLQSTGML